MTISDADIIQTASGSTGSTALLVTVNKAITVANPVVADHAIIAIVAGQAQEQITPQAAGWLPATITNTTADGATMNIFMLRAAGGETSWDFQLTNMGGPMCWVLMEIQGLASVEIIDRATPVAVDQRVDNSTSATGFVASLAVGSGLTSQAGDEIVFAAAAAIAGAGGTAPPTLSSCVDTTGGQSGTWARVGTTVVTTIASGWPNVRLDVFRKYPAGDTVARDATLTWASAPDGNSALISALKAFRAVPAKTSGRAATNSMNF
jgi:hypothetical protein